MRLFCSARFLLGSGNGASKVEHYIYGRLSTRSFRKHLNVVRCWQPSHSGKIEALKNDRIPVLAQRSLRLFAQFGCFWLFGSQLLSRRRDTSWTSSATSRAASFVICHACMHAKTTSHYLALYRVRHSYLHLSLAPLALSLLAPLHRFTLVAFVRGIRCSSDEKPTRSASRRSTQRSPRSSDG